MRVRHTHKCRQHWLLRDRSKKDCMHSLHGKLDLSGANSLFTSIDNALTVLNNEELVSFQRVC